MLRLNYSVVKNITKRKSPSSYWRRYEQAHPQVSLVLSGKPEKALPLDDNDQTKLNYGPEFEHAFIKESTYKSTCNFFFY